MDLIKQLSQTIRECIENVDYYRKTLRKIFPEDGLTSLEEFQSLPFTTKDDVKKSYPFGMLGTDLKQVVAYNESSGTSGGDGNRSSRSVTYSTKKDLSKDIARRTSGDLKFLQEDIIFDALPYAYTSSGINFHLAALEAGAMVIPADNGSLMSSYRKQIDIIRRIKPTILITSYPFVHLTLLQKFRVPFQELENLRAVQLCGMAISIAGKAKISQLLGGIPVYNTYGMSEFGAVTCGCDEGFSHVNDGFYIEIINPKTLENLEEGEGGEIVVTTIGREGSPKIRYRTGDVGKITYGTCTCGRKEPRLDVLCRLSDLITINDKNYTLGDFESVFYKHEATTGMYKFELSEHSEITITIDVKGENKEELASVLSSMVKEELGLNVSFECVNPGDARREVLAQQSGSVKSLQSIDREEGDGEWLVTY